MIITPTSPLTTFTGTSVLMEVGNNRCLSSCLTQQYRTSAEQPAGPCSFEGIPGKFTQSFSVTSLEESSGSAEASGVFPNPVLSGNLNFGRQAYQYVLTNNTGTVVKQGVNAEMLDISELPKGVYTIKLDSKVEKVIIQ